MSDLAIVHRQGPAKHDVIHAEDLPPEVLQRPTMVFPVAESEEMQAQRIQEAFDTVTQLLEVAPNDTDARALRAFLTQQYDLESRPQ